MATAGTFILWMGWFGFNGGSVLAASRTKLIDMSNVMLNTNVAAGAGLIAALIYSYATARRYDATLILNGALAGLVSITAGPDYPSSGDAVFIGAVGGVLASIAVPILDKLKIDDVVGLSRTLCSGFWGTLAVALYEADLWVQTYGFLAIAGFIFVTAFIAYKLSVSQPQCVQKETKQTDWISKTVVTVRTIYDKFQTF